MDKIIITPESVKPYRYRLTCQNATCGYNILLDSLDTAQIYGEAHVRVSGHTVEIEDTEAASHE